MRFEVLVEDKSGSIAVRILLEKILGVNGAEHSWKVHPFKGIGRIPKDLHQEPDPANRLLLDNLPRLLRGYGKGLGDYAADIIVVDLDDRNCVDFKEDLLAVLEACDPSPTTLFRIAIEESEAWLLGDRDAVKAAYPNARDSVLDDYEQDAICGTWEVLADAIHAGGSAALKRSRWPAPGIAKCEWAVRSRRAWIRAATGHRVSGRSGTACGGWQVHRDDEGPMQASGFTPPVLLAA